MRLIPHFDMDLVQINAPEFYRDPAFVTWLNDPNKVQATWHSKGTAPNEYSDLFFTYDSGEGSDSDMPGVIWNQICAFIQEHFGDNFNALIWLTNLED